MKKIAVYPGTFDPVTNGHIDIIERGKNIFNDIIVAVIKNPKKDTVFSSDERFLLLKQATEHIKNVKVEIFDELLVDYVQKKSAHAIIRGVRAISDFDYEFQLAIMNRKLAPDIETVFMIPNEIYSYVSSSVVKEVAKYGGNIDSLVPLCVKKNLVKKLMG
ncbi:pantetheine-phosphate adenylyltransferase [Candidatus Poribacteria bacterium]|nr:pantetheine-phosphate adenylyltransferase [Candidatus Poribacteria bacterium]